MEVWPKRYQGMTQAELLKSRLSSIANIRRVPSVTPTSLQAHTIRGEHRFVLDTSQADYDLPPAA